MIDIQSEHELVKSFWESKAEARASAEPQFRYAYDFFSKYSSQMKEPILDIGCADGHFLKFLAEKGYRDIYGIDISDKFVNIARKKLEPFLQEETDKRIISLDMLNLSKVFKNNFFNTIICDGVLHYTTLSGAKSALEIISQIGKPGCINFFTARSNSIIIDSDKVDGEKITFRAKAGVIRSYYSEQDIKEIISDKFSLVELNERDYIGWVGKKQLKNRYFILIKK
jgi:2-polyprenyl-3-methyl-5-hydroxy-6-metoxy-1,4-benzoquinol methylase